MTLRVKKKPDTLNNFREIIEETKLESLDTSIVLSTAVTRKDKQAIEKKVSVPALNREIREFATTIKISVIDNSNIDVYGKQKSPKSDKLGSSQKNRVFLPEKPGFSEKLSFSREKLGFCRKTKFLRKTKFFSRKTRFF